MRAHHITWHRITSSDMTWHQLTSAWNVRYSPRSNPWDRPVRRAEQAMEGKTAMELQHSCLILVTHETCRRMRGATGVTPQHHQNLRLQRKSNSSFDPKLRDLFPPKEDRFEHDPRTIRALSEDNRMINFSSSTRPFAELTRPILAKEKAFGAPATSQNFTKYCPCHQKLHSNITATSPNTAPALKSEHCSFTNDCTYTHPGSYHQKKSPMIAPATKSCIPTSLQLHQILHLPWKVNTATSPMIAPATKSCIPTSLQLHQILHLPWKVNTATSPMIAPATKSCIPTSLQLRQILRLPWKVTLQLHQWLHLHAPWQLPSKKITNDCACHQKLHSNITTTSPNIAPATTSDIPISPNNTPATKSNTSTSLPLFSTRLFSALLLPYSALSLFKTP